MPLTKKELQVLRSNKASIEVPKEMPPAPFHPHYIVQMSLTMGELLALKNALADYDTATGKDVRAYLGNAIFRAGISF